MYKDANIVTHSMCILDVARHYLTANTTAYNHFLIDLRPVGYIYSKQCHLDIALKRCLKDRKNAAVSHRIRVYYLYGCFK